MVTVAILSPHDDGSTISGTTCSSEVSAYHTLNLLLLRDTQFDDGTIVNELRGNRATCQPVTNCTTTGKNRPFRWFLPLRRGAIRSLQARRFDCVPCIDATIDDNAPEMVWPAGLRRSAGCVIDEVKGKLH